MPFHDLLDHRWYGGSVRTWLIVLAVAVGAGALLLLVRRAASGWLARRAARTRTPLDDMLLELVRRTLAFTIVIVCIAASSRALDFSPGVDASVRQVVRAVLLLQVGVWGAALIGFWVQRYVEQRQGTSEAASRASIAALSFFGRLVLWTFIIVGIIDVFFDVKALVTGLGIGGIAVALAAQNILGDLFAAFAIYTDKPFVVGDFIVADTYMGTVEHIGLKTTRLRSLSGEQIVFGNSELLKARLRNMRRMYERRVVFTLDVTYDTRGEALRRIPAMVREIVEAQRPVRFDRCHFSAYMDSALQFETVYWVLDPDFNLHMDIKQAILLAILDRFRAEGISFAFPTRTVLHEMVPPAGTAGVAE